MNPFKNWNWKQWTFWLATVVLGIILYLHFSWSAVQTPAGTEPAFSITFWVVALMLVAAIGGLWYYLTKTPTIAGLKAKMEEWFGNGYDIVLVAVLALAFMFIANWYLPAYAAAVKGNFRLKVLLFLSLILAIGAFKAGRFRWVIGTLLGLLVIGSVLQEFGSKGLAPKPAEIVSAFTPSPRPVVVRTGPRIEPLSVRVTYACTTSIMVPCDQRIVRTEVLPPGETVDVVTEYSGKFRDGGPYNPHLPRIDNVLQQEWKVKATHLATTYTIYLERSH